MTHFKCPPFICAHMRDNAFFLYLLFKWAAYSLTAFEFFGFGT